MSEFLIVGVDTCYSHEVLRFDGFRLQDITGTVDPFVGGDIELELPETMKEFIGSDGNVRASDIKGYFKAEMEWAESMVGKNLVCDELFYKAFATYGKVSFSTPEEVSNAS